MSVRITLAAIALAAVSIAVSAHARTLTFSYAGDANASWTQSSYPTPNFTFPDGYTNVPVDNGVSGGVGFGDVFFYNGGGFNAGGFAISEGHFTLEEGGPRLFAGSVDHPNFSAGKYDMSNGTLTVTAVPYALPEPSTWALCLVGFGSLGMAARRRRAATA